MPPANLLEALLAFTKLAHLTVDRRKTFAWSTDAGIRKRLRQSGVPVLQQTKGLGAHVAFSRQRTNETVASRIDDLAALCAQLKSSRASYKTKVRVLRTAAWPKGLFAVESTPVSSSTWLNQRRKTIQALQFDNGVNHLLLPGLVESFADPEFVALIKTVSETRAQCRCPLDFWASELFLAACGMLSSPPSPVMVLLARIQSIGLVVHSDGRWEDRVGLFRPATLC